MLQKWWNMENLTPFARRIRDFMLDQRPSMNVADLSKLLREVDPEGKGVTPPAIWDWFYKGALPKEKTVHLIAIATGIPQDELRELVKLPPVSEVPWMELVHQVEHEGRLPVEVRQEILATIRKVRERYESGNSSQSEQTCTQTSSFST